jgi:hypothetical protein
MEIYSIRQGEALEVRVTLLDDQGDPITIYAGTEPLSSPLWPGGNLQAAFNAQATWVDGPSGTIDLTLPWTETATLAEGRYFGTVSLTDSSGQHLEAYRYAVDVLPAQGTAVAPPAYCRLPDLLRHGRRWLRALQSEDVEAGFLDECGQARNWLDELVVARYPTSAYAILGDAGYGSQIWGANPGALPNLWLRGILASGGLVVRPWVVEATAKRALSIVCKGQIGPKDGEIDYRTLGRMFETESSSIALASKAEICTDGSGVPTFGINLGATSVRPRVYY